ncbi:exportin-6-like [Littorina saxatilis]|uniref:Importin N-terminal domain-containing protein n=1 Tax=Littorina saxatilis TaxID=31220 RepID=A0AAN9BVZ7_9CAEN
MASNEESLRALEVLMSEFFNPQTSNERKRDIEGQLNNFAQMNEAWKMCLFFITRTQNEYVMMYALNVLETVINKQWMGIAANDKMEIRNSVNQYLLTNHTAVPTYIRNKLVKLVVDIGRLDWPHFYPDFFPSILQLVQQQDTALLGVILLQTVSEELAAPREDLSMARREELHKLLLQQVPTILQLLNNLLESVLEKHRHLVAATPPPSPTQQAKNSRHNSFSLFSSSPIRSDTLLSIMFRSPGRGTHFEALPPLDEASQLLSSTVLTCLAHYFAWGPLSATLTPQLLSTIFHFAAFGCEGKAGRSGSGSATTSPGGYSTQTPYLGVLSMNCINEVLSKNFVPAEFEDFLLQMFQQTFYLLQKLTKESSTNSSGNRLEELDEDYMERFTDFLRLFVGIHLRRFESNPNFPVLEFLELMFKYTFRQPNAEGFFRCLDIWITFLDYLSIRLQERAADMNSIMGKYKEALTLLVSNILQKIMFRFNQSQLEELDDDTLDDDSETEWQHFLRQCLEVVAKVAELITAETFQLIWEPFQEHVDAYFGLEKYVTEGVQGRRLTIAAENDCRRLHCMLRDLSSLLQALGRLADHFIGEHFADRYANSRLLVERLVQVVSYGSKVKLFEVSTETEIVLQQDFVQVHAQALAAIKAYSHWLLQLYTESTRTNQEKDQFYNMIVTLIESVSPLINKQVSERVIHSAAHLLLSITNTIRPPFLLQLPAVQAMYTAATQGSCLGLTIEVQLLVYRSLSHYLLLPWPGLSDKEQDWTSRGTHHQTFAARLAKDYIALKDNPNLATSKELQEQAKAVIRRVLRVSQDWIESIAGEVVRTRQLLYTSLSPVIQTTLAIFSIYIGQIDIVDNIMGFFLALFQGLRVQMGVPFTEQTIHTFMNLFTRELLAETIHQETGVSFRVIEKFLKLLELIVVEPGSAFKAFLPRIINICMEQIYPIISPRPSPDIKSSLYELLHTLVVNNWRYFFPSNILTSMQKRGDAVVEHFAELSSIFQAYGQSFLQPDIAIFRQNLESLEALNYKWKLYGKPAFRETMLWEFMTVLMQVLVHKSHDLLQDDVVITIYNMAVVNFNLFYTKFLPHFLQSMDGLDGNQRGVLVQNFKQEEDLPSFTQSVQRFTNDIRYYRQINSSLPAGSVTF